MASKQISKTIDVGAGYKVTLAVVITENGQAVSAQWEPDVPDHITDEMSEKYVTGRHAFFENISAEVGGTVLVVDL